jgi:DNA-binding NtrC family response regulator
MFATNTGRSDAPTNSTPISADVLLACHRARTIAEQHARPSPHFTPSQAAILSTRWSDEVRGLALAIERSVLLSDDAVIDAAALAAFVPAADPVMPASSLGPVDIEKAMIEAALRERRHYVIHGRLPLCSKDNRSSRTQAIGGTSASASGQVVTLGQRQGLGTGWWVRK